MVKQKRKEKAGKWAVPLPKVRAMGDNEVMKVMRTGKRQSTFDSREGEPGGQGWIQERTPETGRRTGKICSEGEGRVAREKEDSKIRSFPRKEATVKDEARSFYIYIYIFGFWRGEKLNEVLGNLMRSARSYSAGERWCTFEPCSQFSAVCLWHPQRRRGSVSSPCTRSSAMALPANRRSLSALYGQRRCAARRRM